MKLKTLMIINTVVAAVFGLGFLIIPGQIHSFYGTEANLSVNFMSQLFGTALIGFAILTYLARNTELTGAGKAIVVALFISDVIGFVVSLIEQLQGVINSLGWSTVAIYLLLAIGFGYFSFVKTAAPKEEK